MHSLDGVWKRPLPMTSLVRVLALAWMDNSCPGRKLTMAGFHGIDTPYPAVLPSSSFLNVLSILWSAHSLPVFRAFPQHGWSLMGLLLKHLPSHRQWNNPGTPEGMGEKVSEGFNDGMKWFGSLEGWKGKGCPCKCSHSLRPFLLLWQRPE